MSTTTEGDTIAGEDYRIFCTVLFPIGLTTPIQVGWYGSNGLITGGDGITLGETLISHENITRSLEFSPLRTSHGGQFRCRASVTSSAPPYTFTRSAEVDIIVDGEDTIILCSM